MKGRPILSITWETALKLLALIEPLLQQRLFFGKFSTDYFKSFADKVRCLAEMIF